MSSTRVLFLCTHNSARSQIAEALLRSRGRGAFEVESAGTEATHDAEAVRARKIRAFAASRGSTHFEDPNYNTSEKVLN